MNHLRELLETLEKRRWGTPQTLAELDATIQDTRREVLKSGPSAVCFSIGDVFSLAQLHAIDELCHIPYPITWFEGTISDGAGMFGFLAQQDISEFRGILVCMQKHKWMPVCRVRGLNIADNNMEVQRFFNVGHGIVETPILAVKAFLSALHCKNVARIEHAPDEKLQKARAKRGKQPLFSYWTLQLSGSVGRNPNMGGTHSSPRVHLRRGHPRQYALGEWTWVQPCVVGNRANGMVHKDYSAGPALVAAAR